MANIKLPEPLSSIPRLNLLFNQASPIEKLENVTRDLNVDGALETTAFWIKREDCNSGLAFGGNKIRKLEYVLADAVASGADTLVTIGGIQNIVAIKNPNYHNLGNVQLTHLMNATHEEYDTSEEKAMEKLRLAGKKPYFIPPGASTNKFGGLGYVRFAYEVANQEAEIGGVFFDTIIVTAGSRSTQAGMIAGFKLLGGAKRKIIGIDVAGRPVEQQRKMVLQIAKNALELSGGNQGDIQDEDIIIDRRVTDGGSYGILNDMTREAIKYLADKEGIILDPVYTGKAYAGLLSLAKNGELKGSKNVLFVHTGGQASLASYGDLK